MSRPSPIITQRQRSPQPVRSPSPDYINKTAIVSTNSPNSKEISQIISLHNPKQKVPLLEEIAQLRKENKELQDKLNELMNGGRAFSQGSSMGSGIKATDPQINQLLFDIKTKDQQIQRLRSQLSSSPQKINPLRKIPSQSSQSQQLRDLGQEIQRLRIENDGLKDTLRQSQSKSIYQTPQADQSAKKVRELESQNDELKRQLRRLQTEPGLNKRPSIDSLKSFKQDDFSAQKAMMQVQRAKLQIDRNMEEFRVKMSHRIHELEQRILEITRKQAEIENMIDRKKDIFRASAEKSNSQSVSRRSDQARIEQPPSFGERYSTPIRTQQTVVKNESTAPFKNQGEQLGQQMANEHMRRELESKSMQINRLTDMNELLRSEIDKLNRDVTKLQEKSPKQTTFEPSPSLGFYQGSSALSSQSVFQRPNLDQGRQARQNEELKAQNEKLAAFIEQLRSEKFQRDLEVNNLNKTISELRVQMTKSESLMKPEDVSQIQTDNKKLRQTLQNLRQSHADLLGQLEKTRRETSVVQTSIKDIESMKNELVRLKSLNEDLERQKSSLRESREQEIQKTVAKQAEEATRELERQYSRRSTEQLSSLKADLARERERNSLKETEYQNLRMSFDRLNAEIAQIQYLKDQINVERQETEKYKKIAEDRLLDLSIAKREKDNIQKSLGQIDDYRRRLQDMQISLRIKDEQITNLKKPYRSPALDAILEQLEILKGQLQRFEVDSIRSDFNSKSERLRILLTEKSNEIKSLQKTHVESEQLKKEIAKLRRQNLELSAKLSSFEQEINRQRSTINTLLQDKQTYLKEIENLKLLISQYTSTKDSFGEEYSYVTEEEDRQLRVLEQELYRSQTSESTVLHDLDNIKTGFKYAVIKIENISKAIVQELEQPRLNTLL